MNGADPMRNGWTGQREHRRISSGYQFHPEGTQRHPQITLIRDCEMGQKRAVAAHPASDTHRRRRRIGLRLSIHRTIPTDN